MSPVMVQTVCSKSGNQYDHQQDRGIWNHRHKCLRNAKNIGPPAGLGNVLNGTIHNPRKGQQHHVVIIEQQVRPGTFRIAGNRSEEHTSELQSLMRISYAVFCLKKKTKNYNLKYKQRK